MDKINVQFLIAASHTPFNSVIVHKQQQIIGTWTCNRQVPSKSVFINFKLLLLLHIVQYIFKKDNEVSKNF